MSSSFPSGRREISILLSARLSAVAILLPFLTAASTLCLKAAPVRVLLTAFGSPEGVVASAEALETSSDGRRWTPAPGGSAALCPPGQALTAPLLLRSRDGTVTLTRGNLSRTYRGVIEVVPGPSPAIVNSVELEDYLRSVVPSEMPRSWPLEALKAQAVAARSYALGSGSRHRAQKADLCDSTHCQVYRGTSAESAPTDLAVAETRGLVLVQGGRILPAQFCADCGGMPAPAAAGEADILKPDASEEGTHFCEQAPSHRWSARISQRALLEALGEQRQGAVRRVRIEARDASGRITAITIEHDFGTVSLNGAGLRSRLAPAGIRSALCRFEADPETGDLIVSGLGHGHGAGLCQWGARGRALPPWNQDFRTILQHYYPAAALEAIGEAPGGAADSASLSGSRPAP
jgi:stage II sporulation protein D